MHRTRCPRLLPAARLLAVLALVSLLVSGGPPLGARAAAAPSLTTTATTVVSLLAQGGFTAAEHYFAPALQQVAPAARLQQIWQQLTSQLGAFERQTGATAQTTGGVQSVFVHCLFARATADLVIGFDSSGKVAGLHVANVQPTGAPAKGRPGITPQAALIRILTRRPMLASWFAPSVLAVISVAQLEQQISSVTTVLGPYKSVAPLPTGGFRVRFRDGTIDVGIHLDTQGRIDGLAVTSSPRLTVTGLLSPGAPPGVAGRAAAVNALLTERLQHHQFSGSVLVAVQGKVALAQGYGYADAAQRRPNTIDTEFRIGSITKQFTAMAILELQAAGKLSIHDKLCRYVHPCPVAWAPITLQELLSHTSGIHDYTALPAYVSGMDRPVTPAQVLGLLRPLPLDFTSGAKFAYSNSNYYLLGIIIEEVSGQTYASYLQQHILAPLLLQQTGYDANHPDLRTHAVGYASWSSPAPFVDIAWPFAAGALYSSVVDLWHWDEALLSDTLIAKAATTDMLAPHATTCPTSPAACPENSTQSHYGYGWFSGTLGSHQVIDHSGGINGFTAINEIMPEDGITIVLLSNQENSGAGSFLGLALAQIMLGQS
jgi:CubicO group peptidase (beta-lactamase class C family)